MDRIKDYLLMEEEFIKNEERLKPQDEKHEVFWIYKETSFIHNINNIINKYTLILLLS